MRLMFISDIHGIRTNLNTVKYRFNELKCDKLVVLGDLFYVGPYKSSNADYDSEYVVNFLNEFTGKIICMRGNCDSTIDIEAVNFPVLNDLSLIIDNELDIYITHGNTYNPNNIGKIETTNDTVLVYGHEHIPFIKRGMNMTFINVGSVSLPKTGYEATYMIYENREFTICDFKSNIISRTKL